MTGRTTSDCRDFAFGIFCGFQHRNGMPADEIMAFGDSENDAEMLRGAGIGAAMGNADSAARRAPDDITKDIDANGIRNGLVHDGLLGA